MKLAAPCTPAGDQTRRLRCTPAHTHCCRSMLYNVPAPADRIAAATKPDTTLCSPVSFASSVPSRGATALLCCALCLWQHSQGCHASQRHHRQAHSSTAQWQYRCNQRHLADKSPEDDLLFMADCASVSSLPPLKPLRTASLLHQMAAGGGVLPAASYSAVPHNV